MFMLMMVLKIGVVSVVIELVQYLSTVYFSGGL